MTVQTDYGDCYPYIVQYTPNTRPTRSFTKSQYFPGGPTSQSAGIIGWQFDWPPKMGDNKLPLGGEL